VGSPAWGSAKKRWEKSPRKVEAKSKMTMRRRGRSTLANADKGDLGERRFTWKMNLMSNLHAELLFVSTSQNRDGTPRSINTRNEHG
jgi:hypothetical protein